MALLTNSPHLKLAALRVSRLAADCTYVEGANNAITTAAAISFSATADTEEGTEILQRNGDGAICLSIKDPDELKRLDVEFEICTRNPYIIELLTGEPVALDAGGDAIGSQRSVGLVQHPGVFLEIWVRAGSSTGSCVTGASNFIRYIYPKATFVLGDSEWSNGLNNLQLTGTVESNPNALDGAFSDLPVVGNIPATAVEYWMADPAGLPVIDDSDYIAVPAGANLP